MKETIVITTDELESAVRLRDALRKHPFATELLTSGESLADVAGEPVLLVITGGLRSQRARGLISAARQRGRLPVVGFVDSGDQPGRAFCRQMGISECFGRGADPEEVALVARRLIERERLREITGIVGETDVMEEVLERVVQIAGVHSTVIIQGESGTGKELVARGIHALSARRHRPFIAVNVAALPENLLESELFGHEKGAFTGAASLRKGLFELAHQGTIFLDEIGEMSLATQTKLLRVLEEREFRRVGGEEVQRVDVRVIAATNRNLREQVELSEFRRDLYHRLNVLRIEMPALRERREDIPRLIERFIREFSLAYDRPFRGIDAEALQILTDYAWPGNVRELRNLVESMVVLAPGRTILPEDIPPEVRGARRSGALVPVLASQPAVRRGDGTASPEIEFVLRTLFEMKIDLDDLRREFESYKQRQRREVEVPLYPSAGGAIIIPAVGDAPFQFPQEAEEAEEQQPGAIVFRPGMTMQQLEREAIAAALREVEGNRRRAAEMLGIGERTLYRKIKEYELEKAE